MSIIVIKNNKLLLITKLTIKTHLQLISLKMKKYVYIQSKHYLQVISIHKLLLIFIKKTFTQILLLITKLTIKSYLQLISLKKNYSVKALQSTLSKTDTFGTGTKCPSQRDVRLIKSQIKGISKGRDQLQVFVLQRCPSYRGVRRLYLQFLSIKKKDT